MVKISVIIPVYNTASYLKECLDSVINQSLDDIEIICVNDGSTDSSLDILKSYESRDSRITVISQENKGLASARNVAMEYATGDYLFFLDSDDYIEEDALSEVYNLAVLKSLDLVLFKLINFDNETYEKTKVSYFEMAFLKRIVGDRVFTWMDVKHRLFDISVTAPGKLFKREIIQKNKFPEGLIFEDTLFFTKVIFNTRRIYFHDKVLYYRRVRKDSITNSYFDRFTDCIIIYDLIEEFIKRIRKYDEFSEQIFNNKCRDIFTRFSTVDEQHKPHFFEEIKSNFKRNEKRLKMHGVLKICSERSLEIFNSALNCQTYKEFELSVNVFDLKRDNDRLKLNNDMLERRYNKKFLELEKDAEYYQNEVEVLKNSTSWKVTKLFRSITTGVKLLLEKLGVY